MTLTSPLVMQRLAPLGGPLAGRVEEMDALRRAWDDAQAGRFRMVLLAGEPGVGKTRLAAELAGDVDAAGAAVLVGGCPVGGAEPYHPLAEALGVLPTGHSGRDALLDTIAHAVAARAGRVPLLLVLDDLHRADRSTLLALRRLAEVAAGAPVLVVATYRNTAVDRSHPLSEFLAAVLSRPGVERVNVEGMPPDAVAQMVGDAELGIRMWRQSAGNPVMVSELLRPGALDGPPLSGLDELVARRVAALGRAERSFLEAAAVAGPEFPVDVVACAAGVPAERAARVLKDLAAAGFVVKEPGDVRRFVHDLVREAVERGLEPSVRVQLHKQVGRALDAANQGPAALVAWHFRAAAPVGGSARAMRHSARAGERAMELLAWDEAAVQFGHALAASTGASPEARADLLLSLGEAQRLAGEGARARQAFLEAAALARSCADGSRMARAALAIGQVAAVWGDDAELEAVASEARSLLGRASLTAPAKAIDAPPAPAGAIDFASGALYDALDGVEPADHRPVSVAAAGPVRVAASGNSVALLRARHLALAGPEHASERLATADSMVSLARESGNDQLTATALGWRLVDAMHVGRIDQAERDRDAHAEVARRLGDACPAADAAAWSAMQALLEGRVDDARSETAEAFDLAVEAGDPEAGAAYLLQRWWLALEWGRADELAAAAAECRAQASTAANGRTWRAAAALALARAGQVEPAAEELRRVTDHGLGELVREPGRLLPLACLAEVAWRLGDGYRAAAVGPLLEPFADQLAVGDRALVCHGSVARACGMVAASAHRWDDADRHFQSALAVHHSIGALPLLARTRFEWSTVLLSRGRKLDRRRAAESRRKAVELATGLGMARLLEELAGGAT